MPSLPRFLLVLAGSFTLVSLPACEEEQAGPDDGGGAGGSGAGGSSSTGGAGGSEPCPAGSHAADGGGCEATLAEWTTGPALAQKRDHHLTFVAVSDAGPMLYAAGGVVDNAQLLSSVEIAPIAADGSLGPWATAAPLPEAAAGAGIAVVDNTVIVTGGYRLNGASPALSAETDVGKVLPDGSLGGWTVGPALGKTRFHHAMAVDGARIYAIGGLTGNNTDNIDTVEVATVSPDGTVSDWAEVAPLPTKRSHHSAVVHAGAIYVTGGLEGNPSSTTYVTFDEVLRAPIQADGTLGEWSVVGHMPDTLTTHASFVHAGSLYVVGGIEGDSHNTGAVRRAPIGADGAVGAWESLPDLPKARAHAHQAPFFEGHAYAVAGAYNHQSIADVYVGRFE